MADPNDEGRGNSMAVGAGSDRKSTGYGPKSSTNPTGRTGRDDGTDGGLATPSGRRAGAKPYRGSPGATNPTARTGRPDADMSAPPRSYEKAKSGTQKTTDASAGRVRQSRA